MVFFNFLCIFGLMFLSLSNKNHIRFCYKNPQCIELNDKNFQLKIEEIKDKINQSEAIYIDKMILSEDNYVDFFSYQFSNLKNLSFHRQVQPEYQFLSPSINVLTPKIVEAILTSSFFENLEILNLSNTSLSFRHFEFLQTIENQLSTNIHTLNLNNNRLQKKAFKLLSKINFNGKIRNIFLNGNSLIYKESIESILSIIQDKKQKLKKIKSLNLDFTSISGANLIFLLENIDTSELQSFSIGQNSLQHSSQFSIPFNNSIYKILSQKNLSQIKNLKMNRLDLDQEQFQYIKNIKIPQIQNLDISYNFITNDYFRYWIIEENMPKLRKLNIIGGDFSDQAIKLLVENRFQYLQDFRIGENRKLTSNHYKMFDQQFIEKLKFLHLQNNILNNQNIQILFQDKEFTNLQTLIFSNTLVRQQGQETTKNLLFHYINQQSIQKLIFLDIKDVFSQISVKEIEQRNLSFPNLKILKIGSMQSGYFDQYLSYHLFNLNLRLIAPELKYIFKYSQSFIFQTLKTEGLPDQICLQSQYYKMCRNYYISENESREVVLDKRFEFIRFKQYSGFAYDVHCRQTFRQQKQYFPSYKFYEQYEVNETFRQKVKQQFNKNFNIYNVEQLVLEIDTLQNSFILVQIFGLDLMDKSFMFQQQEQQEQSDEFDFLQTDGQNFKQSNDQASYSQDFSQLDNQDEYYEQDQQDELNEQKQVEQEEQVQQDHYQMKELKELNHLQSFQLIFIFYDLLALNRIQFCKILTKIDTPVLNSLKIFNYGFLAGNEGLEGFLGPFLHDVFIKNIKLRTISLLRHGILDQLFHTIFKDVTLPYLRQFLFHENQITSKYLNWFILQHNLIEKLHVTANFIEKSLFRSIIPKNQLLLTELEACYIQINNEQFTYFAYANRQFIRRIELSYTNFNEEGIRKMAQKIKSLELKNSQNDMNLRICPKCISIEIQQNKIGPQSIGIFLRSLMPFLQEFTITQSYNTDTFTPFFLYPTKISKIQRESQIDFLPEDLDNRSARNFVEFHIRTSTFNQKDFEVLSKLNFASLVGFYGQINNIFNCASLKSILKIVQNATIISLEIQNTQTKGNYLSDSCLLSDGDQQNKYYELNRVQNFDLTLTNIIVPLFIGLFYNNIQHQNYLKFSNFKLGDDAFLQILNKVDLSNIKELSLQGNYLSSISLQRFWALYQLKNFQGIDLSDNLLTDDFIDGLIQNDYLIKNDYTLSNVQAIFLSKNALTDQFIQKLVQIKFDNLQTLDLSYTDITVKGLRLLYGLKASKLIQLKISFINITFDDLIWFLQDFPSQNLTSALYIYSSIQTNKQQYSKLSEVIELHKNKIQAILPNSHYLAPQNMASIDF